MLDYFRLKFHLSMANTVRKCKTRHKVKQCRVCHDNSQCYYQKHEEALL